MKSRGLLDDLFFHKIWVGRRYMLDWPLYILLHSLSLPKVMFNSMFNNTFFLTDKSWVAKYIFFVSSIELIETKRIKKCVAHTICNTKLRHCVMESIQLSSHYLLIGDLWKEFSHNSIINRIRKSEIVSNR